MSNQQRTTNIVIAALGGEGGGVLVDWIAQVARNQHWLAQSTSVAGVAQRTGATIYYLELFPGPGNRDNRHPVMSLFPTRGDVDIAIASEIVEAGRMVQRGFVTPQRTTLITSDHRIFGITEKSNLADGRVSKRHIEQVAARYAKQFMHFDMLALAEHHGTVISATLFGALAGSKALPFVKQSFESVIENSGIAVQQNLAAFRASYDIANNTASPAAVSATEPMPFCLPAGTTVQGRELIQRLQQEFPPATHEILYLGLQKLIDYQDFSYAHQYLNKVAAVAALDQQQQGCQLTRELGRYLALWMCYEDIARVAQIKTRAARGKKLREEVRAEDNQLVYITEFFAPRIEEFCAYLPPKLADWILASRFCRKFLGLFTGGKRLRTNTVFIFILLRIAAAMRCIRRYGWAYHREHQHIDRWLCAVKDAATDNYELALELVECARIVKGYGETRERGSSQINLILESVEQHTSRRKPEWIATARNAALADDEGAAFYFSSNSDTQNANSNT